jgi:hypothetical protein
MVEESKTICSHGVNPKPHSYKHSGINTYATKIKSNIAPKDSAIEKIRVTIHPNYA